MPGKAARTRVWPCTRGEVRVAARRTGSPGHGTPERRVPERCVPERLAAWARVAEVSPRTAPSVAPARAGRRPAGASSATTRPSRITTTRSAVERISPSRCEIRTHAAAAGHEAAHVASSCAGDAPVQRRGRLVQDHQLDRRVGRGEGARDLDHLPPADRRGRRPASPASMPWPGKISSSLPRDQRARHGAASRSRERGMHDARVLGHGQVRAERQLLEDAAHAVRCAPRDRHSRP